MAQELTFNITEDVRRLKRPTSVKDFQLSFGHADQGPTDVVIGDDGNIVQGRYGDSARQVFVNVVQGKNNEPVDITGYLPEFNGCIPDAEHIVIDNWDGVLVDPRHGRFRFDFPIQAFTVAGSYKQAYFRLVQNGTGKTLATLEFDLQVLEDFVYSNIVPQDYVTPYLDMINKLKDAYTNFVGKTQDSFDQAKKRLDDIMSTVEDKADTVEQRLKIDEQALTELSEKIDEKGLFTQAEADAFKQTITEKITELSNDVLHKTGDQTILDDKAGFAIFKDGINQSIDGGINWGTLAIAKTPSLYGAVGDGRDDGAGLQRAIDDNYGKTLAIDRDYSTNQQLKIKDTINLVFTTGSIKATKEMDSLIAVTAGTVCFASSGISQKDYINLNNAAHAGIVQTGGEIHLNQIRVGKLPAGAVGIDVSNHANITATNVTISNRFNGKQDQIPTGTIGIHLYSTWDNQLSNINTVEIQIGMWFEKTGNNFINYYHPWSVAPTIAGKTTGIKFGNAATDFNYFSHLYLDTCAKGMDFMNDTNVYINGLFNYFNSDYYNKSLNYPTPTLFYYEDQGDTGSGVHLIHGNLQNPKDMPVNFTNLTKLQTLFEVAQTQFDNYHNRPLVEDKLNYLSGGDLNDITCRGNYKFYSDNNSGSFSNQPISNDTYFILEVSSFEGTNGVQRYYSTNTGNVYIRQWHRGSMYDNKYFYPWRKLEYFSDDK